MKKNSNSQQIQQVLEEKATARYGRVRTLLWLLMLPILILTISWGAVAVYNHWFTDGDIKRVVERNWYFAGRPITVNLIPNLPDAKITAVQPLRGRVLFCLDTSGSMGSHDKTGDPLFEAMNAIRKMARYLLASGNEIGLLVFADECEVVVRPTKDIKILQKGMENLPEVGDGTNIAHAMEKSAGELLQNTQVPNFEILVSDGMDNISGAEAIVRNYGDRINFVGVSIGESADLSFFDRVFFSPHRYLTSANDYQTLADILTDTALDYKLLTIRGTAFNLWDYPHLSALPLYRSDDEERPVVIEPVVDNQAGSVSFSMTYMFDSLVPFPYILKAKAWGIHPVAVRQAHLDYISNKDHRPRNYVSGRSPIVLVLSPWLLLLLFLPALIHLLSMLSPRKAFNIRLPGELPKPEGQYFLPSVPIKRFQRGTLTPLSPAGEDGLVPTVVVAIGTRGGEILAGLIHNRLEAGLKPVSDIFLPIYIDCRQLKPEQLPAFRDGKVTREMYFCFPRNSNLTDLIVEITEQPEKHKLAVTWARAQEYRGRSIKISDGCGGDRRLARLALYQDLSSDQPVLAEITARIEAWMKGKTSTLKSHMLPQIFLVAAGQEDLGSGWLTDMGFHIRYMLGDRSVPIFALLDLSKNLTHARPDNAEALMHELTILQGANGWPLGSMMLSSENVVENETVLLPLFDRVIDIHSQNVSTNIGTISAAILELMDYRVREKNLEATSDVALAARASEAREKTCFMTRLMGSTVLFPVYRWRKKWVMWTVRDVIKWLNDYSIINGMVTMTLSTEQPADTWKDMKHVGSSLDNRTLDYWDFVLDNQYASLRLPKYNADEMTRQWLTIASNYLNASPKIQRPERPVEWMHKRSGRFINLVELADVLHQRILEINSDPDIAATDVNREAESAIEEIKRVLAGWREVFWEGKDPPSLLMALGRRIDELDSPDPSIERGQGRIQIDHSFWTIDFSEEYEKRLYTKLISETGELPSRLWWAPSADGETLDLIFHGMDDVRLTQEDVANGRLHEEIERLLMENLHPEMLLWSLEELTMDKGYKHAVDQIPFVHGGHLFLFHGFQHEKKEAVLQAAAAGRFSAPRTSPHTFTDRFSCLVLQENQPWESLTDGSPQDLPLILPQAIIPCDLERRQVAYSEKTGSELDPISKLLAQDMQLIEIASIIHAQNRIYQEGQSAALRALFFSGRLQKHQLTSWGDVSPSSGLYQIMLRRQDIFGNPIDLMEVLSEWRDKPREERHQILEGFVRKLKESNRRLEDWEWLLLWKVSLDLRDGGGLL